MGLELQRLYKIQLESTCNFPGVTCDNDLTRHALTSILESLNNGPVIEAIKEQTSVVTDKLQAIAVYVDVARKVLTILSIIFLIMDAVRY